MTDQFINRAGQESYTLSNGQIHSLDLRRHEGLPDLGDPTLQYITSLTRTIGIAAGLAHSLSNNNIEATLLLKQPHSTFIYTDNAEVVRVEYLEPNDPSHTARWHQDLKENSPYYQSLTGAPWSQDCIVSAHIAELSLRGHRIGGRFTHVIFLDMIKDTALQMVIGDDGLKVVQAIDEKYKSLIRTLYQYGIIPIAQNGKVIPYSLLT